MSQLLLRLLVSTFVASGTTVELVIDETLERRWGRKISKRGHWRDSLASSKGLNVSTSGLRWLGKFDQSPYFTAHLLDKVLGGQPR